MPANLCLSRVAVGLERDYTHAAPARLSPSRVFHDTHGFVGTGACGGLHSGIPWGAGDGATDDKIALRDGDRIIFFGDSLTALAGRKSPSSTSPRATSASSGRRCNETHKDKNIEVDWVATGGHTVPDLLKRVDKDVIAKKPTIVVIQIGCNDARRLPKETFKASLEELIDRLQKEKIQVIQCTLTSVGEKHDGTNKDDPKLEEFAEVEREVAKAKKVPLNDLRKAFVDYWKKNNPDNKAERHPDLRRQPLQRRRHEFVAEQMLKRVQVNPRSQA